MEDSVKDTTMDEIHYQPSPGEQFLIDVINPKAFIRVVRLKEFYRAMRVRVGITGTGLFPNIELHLRTGEIIQLNGRTEQVMGFGPFIDANASPYFDNFFEPETV